MTVQGHVGREVDNEAEYGASMKGVTAHEQVFAAGDANVESSLHGGAPVIDPVTGQPFTIPVNSEGKSKVLRVWTLQRPHHLSFWVSTLSFFVSFVSVFAPAAMVPAIRENIDLDKGSIGNAGIAAVCGTILARVIMGQVCDTVGPRYGHSVLMLLTAPGVFCMGLVTNPAGFIICRLIIGFSLATFVANQFWTSSLFAPNVVGLANATSGGWGNLGGGITQLLMPVIFEGFQNSYTPFRAWRYVFFVPGSLHLIVALLILVFGRDTPFGNYADVKQSGQMSTLDSKKTFIAACANYRTWCLVIIYAGCFGIELTMNNVVVSYFVDHFDMQLTIAGLLGSLFGLMNLFARSCGGLLSDKLARPYGMRGRLWALFACMFAEGVACIIMGLAKDSLAATVVVMIVFSAAVQASEGATFGVVPFVSRRALGVVSGFVGAGGNAGSAITQAIFFSDNVDLETYEGIMYMGLFILGMTMLTCFIYFPMWGGMFKGPSINTDEESYYLSDYTKEEVAAGHADAAMKFATEARSQRGAKGVQQFEESQKGQKV
ncbi:unnamed protein product [Pedinophyceae sp. YPF-701]|nr:unnamed protein product [Pedinophyceae sp. YPF-701]